MTFEILTTATCRWSIRNLVALEEKGADYRLVDVLEKGAKAAWFTALTPFGKTPALRHGDNVVVESRIINEYIEEVASGRSLLPTDPTQRAWARTWSGYCDEEMMPRLRVVITAEDPQQGLQKLGLALERLEAHLFRHATPGRFWGGSQLSLTDISFWSFFDVLERFGELQPVRSLLASQPRLEEWSGHLLSHPAFAAADASLRKLSPS